MARVLLIVGGGIAAYKSLELVRLLKKAGHQVTPVLTKGGEHFVTAMSLGTLAESQVHTSLWELKDEVEIGHIQLSRAADLVLVCPATADLLAKMAAGIADDLATTLLLATDKPVVVAPAMNVRMWLHAATQRNIAQLKADGVRVIEPPEGQMADAVAASLPADAAILVAAVADWRVLPSPSKLKKGDGPPQLHFIPTRDILGELGTSPLRPRLLIGFAAETERVVEQAVAKREAKRADWIVANDVSGDVMGGHRNRAHLITADGVEDWPEDSKKEVARRLIARVADALG